MLLDALGNLKAVLCKSISCCISNSLVESKILHDEMSIIHLFRLRQYMRKSFSLVLSLIFVSRT